MQRTLISIVVFVCVMLIFDMMTNDGRITHDLYGVMRTTARHFDNYASSLAAYLNRG
jgi:hypothetical protein